MEQNQCYHLVSPTAHRAVFFTDNGENDCAETLRETLGIGSRAYFSRCYLAPLMEKNLVARTSPDHLMSPIRKYKLS